VGELDIRRAALLGALALLAALLACGDSAPPRRVVSLSESTTRVAQALGLGDRLQTLDARAPDVLERAFRSGANLALADGSAESADARAAFSSRSAAVRVFSPTSTEEVFAAYTEIATVLGQPKAAAKLIEQVTREVKASATGGARPKIALVVSRSPLRVVAGDAFLSHLLDLAGIDNVFAGDKAVTELIGAAQLDARKPDRVLDVSPAMLADAWVDPVATTRSLQTLASGG
jgi:ABC-type Fe3+-hydroxamate transport system substrate-binding protein